MRLDMYLNGHLYLATYNTELNTLRNVLNGVLTEQRGTMTVTKVITEAAYWRKAKAIHHWFVMNIQKGNDDCGEYYVSQAKLQDLLTACVAVMENKTRASELLPTKNGFFFGSTQYDEDYFSDIADTIKMLEPLISDKYARWEFYYNASW